jgi:hypothetical protein
MGSDEMLVLTASGAAADVSGAEDPGPEQAASAATATIATAIEADRPRNPPTVRG